MKFGYEKMFDENVVILIQYFQRVDTKFYVEESP